MFAVEMKFPIGRYHATPWDRQVNEGVVEWPPSPWRLLRALISTWHLKAREISENTVRELILKLTKAPSFNLPPVTTGHTRHYMRQFDEKTAKVFDTFVSLRKDMTMTVIWDSITLTSEEEKAAALLLERLGYLGRAESIVEAHIMKGTGVKPNCTIFNIDQTAAPDYEIIRVLSPLGPEEYLAWRKEYLEISIAYSLGYEPKTGGRKKKSNEIELPLTIFEALLAETDDLKVKGWSQPPGTKWIEYKRRSDAFNIQPRTKQGGGNRSRITLPTVARYAVASNVPPRFTEAISIADRIHIALVSRSDGSPIFTGCDKERIPLSGHNHAFILCESNLAVGKGKRGEITHVTVYCSGGFDKTGRKAIDSLTKVWGHGGYDIQLVLLGVGSRADFAGLDREKGECPILAESKVWSSRTPFIPTRHPKATRAGVPKMEPNGLQIGSPEHDLRRLLRENGFPEPISIILVPDTNLAGRNTTWLEFRRERKDGRGSKTGNRGFGFRIEFREPIRGPIALGYGAHFGLGLFVPDIETDRN